MTCSHDLIHISIKLYESLCLVGVKMFSLFVSWVKMGYPLLLVGRNLSQSLNWGLSLEWVKCKTSVNFWVKILIYLLLLIG